MIVDLLRNDLGRLARIGGVQVERLFEIEDYATLFQMTSTIRAEIDASMTLDRVFEALFPCGFVRPLARRDARSRPAPCRPLGARASDPNGRFTVCARRAAHELGAWRARRTAWRRFTKLRLRYATMMPSNRVLPDTGPQR